MNISNEFQGDKHQTLFYEIRPKGKDDIVFNDANRFHYPDRNDFMPSPELFNKKALELVKNKVIYGSDSLFYPKSKYIDFLYASLQKQFNLQEAQKRNSNDANEYNKSAIESLNSINGKPIKRILEHFQVDKEDLYYENVVKDWDDMLRVFEENNVNLNDITAVNITSSVVRNEYSYPPEYLTTNVEFEQNGKNIYITIIGELIGHQWKLLNARASIENKSEEPAIQAISEPYSK